MTGRTRWVTCVQRRHRASVEMMDSTPIVCYASTGARSRVVEHYGASGLVLRPCIVRQWKVRGKVLQWIRNDRGISFATDLHLDKYETCEVEKGSGPDRSTTY